MSVKIASLFAEISADTTKFDKGLKDSKAELTGFSGNIKKGIGSLAGMVFGAAIAGLAIGAFTKFMKASVNAAAEAEQAQAQVEAVLRSTGEAAGLSMRDIQAYSGELQKLSGVEDDYFMKMQAVMLTFTRVTKDSFMDATKAALDMSVALGTDMQSSVIMVGKALNVASGDVAGASMAMSAMKRVGVAFTTDQIDMAKKLIETGDAAGYQALILKELNVEFGGSAAARLNTYAGKVDALKVAFGNAQEAVGQYVIESKLLLSVLESTINFTNDVTDGVVLYNKAKKLGIDIEGSWFNSNRYVNGVLVDQEDILRMVSSAEYENSDALSEATRAAGKMATGIADLNYDLEEQAAAAEAAAQATNEYYKSVIGMVPQIQDLKDKLGEARDEYADLLKSRPWDKKALATAKTQVEDLEAAVKRQTQKFITDMIIQKLSIGGLSEAEGEFILDYMESTGQLDHETRLQASYIMGVSDTISNIPGNKRISLFFDLYGYDAAMAAMAGMGVNPAQQSNPTAPTPIKPPVIQMRAGGGMINQGDWAMVGENGIEWVNATPNGAMVYNKSQMGNKSPSGINVYLTANVNNNMDVETMAYRVANVIARRN